MLNPLPAEVRLHIYSFLSKRNLVAASAVCRASNTDSQLWYALITKEFKFHAPINIDNIKSLFMQLMTERSKLLEELVLNRIAFNFDTYNEIDNMRLSRQIIENDIKQTSDSKKNEIEQLKAPYNQLLSYFLSSDENDFKSAQAFLYLNLLQSKEDFFQLILDGICKIGAENLLEIILSKQINLFTENNAASALHEAITAMQVNIVDKLIKHGANVNGICLVYNFDGENMLHLPSPLRLAIMNIINGDTNINASKNIIHLLLENGADPDLAEKERDFAPKHCDTARTLCQERYDQVSDEIKEIFNMILLNKPKENYQQNQDRKFKL